MLYVCLKDASLKVPCTARCKHTAKRTAKHTVAMSALTSYCVEHIETPRPMIPSEFRSINAVYMPYSMLYKPTNPCMSCRTTRVPLQDAIKERADLVAQVSAKNEQIKSSIDEVRKLLGDIALLQPEVDLSSMG